MTFKTNKADRAKVAKVLRWKQYSRTGELYDTENPGAARFTSLMDWKWSFYRSGFSEAIKILATRKHNPEFDALNDKTFQVSLTYNSHLLGYDRVVGEGKSVEEALFRAIILLHDELVRTGKL